MKYFLLGLIKIYQLIPGPIHKMCRYTPTCSEYTKEAVLEHGTIKGLFLGIKRIMRCNPLGGYGYDPVKKGSKLYEEN